MKNGLIVEKDGNKYWYKDDKLHREDGPAIEWADGSKFWYKDGACHREGGPAVEYAEGIRYWYKDGLLHREDGPAEEYANGTKSWYYLGHKAPYEDKFYDLRWREKIKSKEKFK